MQPDPVVMEIRRLRASWAARFNYDVDAILKDAQERDASGDRVVVRRPPRKPGPAQAVARPTRPAPISSDAP